MTRPQQDTQFANWMHEHSSIATRTARAFEFNPEAQADLLQEIFLAWWRSVLRFPERANAKQWLYRISLNVAFTWQRRESRRHRIIDKTAPFTHLVESVPQPADPVDRAALDDLYRAIQQLPATERALVVLHLDGFSYAEISETLGISLSAVGSRLNRVRDHLARLLKGVPKHHERV